MLLIAVIPLFPEYVSFFLVIAAGICALIGRRRGSTFAPLRLGLISKLLMLYVGYTLLSSPFAKKPGSTLLIGGMWLFFLLLFFLLRSLLASRERFEAMAMLITVSAGLVGLIACLQYYIGDFFDCNPIRFWASLDHWVYARFSVQYSELPYNLRTCSTFSHPNMASEFLTMSIPVGVFYSTGLPEGKHKHFSHACLIMMVAGVVFSFSRGGYVALAVLLAALAFFNLRDKLSSIVVYALSGVLLLPSRSVERILSILPGIATSNEILDSFTTSDVEQTSQAIQEIISSSGADMAINIRWKIWFESLRLFWEKPLFGYGAGTYTTWELYNEAGYVSSIVHAHNLPLQLMLEGGIISLALMLLIGFFTLKTGLELMCRPRNKRSFWLGYGVLGFAAALCVQGMFDFPLMTPKLVCYFLVLLALVEQSGFLYQRCSVRDRLEARREKKALLAEKSA